jgi:sRNA-binding protein
MTTLTDYRVELRQILGIDPGSDLPKVFGGLYVCILKIGIHADILERFPSADAEKLSDWLGRYTSEPRYLKRMTKGTNRHDLDRNNVAIIEESAKYEARKRIRALRDAIAEQGKIVEAAE